MRKFLLGGVLCLSALSASALEVVGVNVPEKMQLGEQTLVLNGAGSRFMAGVIHVYVAALYLPENKHKVAEVLDDGRSKNVTIWFLTPLGVKVSSEQLLDATHKLMTENLSADEMKKLDASWKQFATFFGPIKEFKMQDKLSVDYQPGKGMRVSMNGNELGRIAQPEFMRAFLLVWLGEQPAQPDLKDRLLGAASGSSHQ